jgi:GNAT superfamily N-acetyltransferase
LFSASLFPVKYEKFLVAVEISTLNYWLAIDDNTGRVIGTIGLYEYQYDKQEAFWLGWFCVDPELRQMGIGTELLEFAIDGARQAGKKFLRLYSSTDPNESNAHRLYKEYGFVLTKEKDLPNKEFGRLYYELCL